MENGPFIHDLWWFIDLKWWFPIAALNDQRENTIQIPCTSTVLQGGYNLVHYWLYGRYNSSLCQRGKTAPVVVHVFEHMHMLLGRGVGCVNVHVALGHMHMLRQVLVWGVGGVNVHVNLRHMHMPGHVLGWVEWGVLTFMLTCVTCTCDVTSGFPLAVIVGCAQMLIHK